MFAKFSTLALALPLVSALTINPLTGATTGGTVTITWTASTSDPSYFSIEMVNTVFHNTFAIANNVQTSLGTLTIQLPQVPVGDGYSVEAIATNDINTVYSQSGDFSVGDATSSTATASSTTAASTGSASTLSSATLSTPSATGTSPVTSGSASTAAAGTTSASTSASVTPSSLTGGAAPLKLGSVAPAAAFLLSAVAGAAMVF